jgi:hypothetical protein
MWSYHYQLKRYFFVIFIQAFPAVLMVLMLCLVYVPNHKPVMPPENQAANVTKQKKIPYALYIPKSREMNFPTYK